MLRRKNEGKFSLIIGIFIFSVFFYGLMVRQSEAMKVGAPGCHCPTEYFANTIFNVVYNQCTNSSQCRYDYCQVQVFNQIGNQFYNYQTPLQCAP